MLTRLSGTFLSYLRLAFLFYATLVNFLELDIFGVWTGNQFLGLSFNNWFLIG